LPANCSAVFVISSSDREFKFSLESPRGHCSRLRRYKLTFKISKNFRKLFIVSFESPKVLKNFQIISGHNFKRILEILSIPCRTYSKFYNVVFREFWTRSEHISERVSSKSFKKCCKLFVETQNWFVALKSIFGGKACAK
jgi:hypothetical protein